MNGLTRRGFLKKSMLATSGSLLVPQFLKAFEYSDNYNLAPASVDDRVLIILQLSGGNDGLNTVVPFRNDRYYQLRPSIGIKRESVLQLTDDLGFNPALSSFRELYDHGSL